MSVDGNPTAHHFILHEIQRRRRSPYAFSSQPIEEELIRGLFEAARHAPSSFNEQPWRFVVARRDLDPRTFGKFVEASGRIESALGDARVDFDPRGGKAKR